MLRLVSPDLPTVVYPQRSAPFLRLYPSSHHSLAPIFRFDVFSLLLGKDNDISSPLDSPDYAGLMHRISLDFSFQLISCPPFQILESPLAAVPLTLWTDGQTLTFYDSYLPSLTPATPLTLQIQVTATVPEPVASQYEIDLTAFTPITVESLIATGLTFRPAADELLPLPGEFVQSGNQLILYGSNEWQIRPADPAIILASKTVTIPEPMAWALTFDLSNTEIEQVVAAEYLGRQYLSALNAWVPQVGDLFWQAPLMTLFSGLDIGKPQVRTQTYLSTADSGSLSYLSYS